MRTMIASALARCTSSRASECATTAMSAAMPHSSALSARGAAAAGSATASNTPANSLFTLISKEKRPVARAPCCYRYFSPAGALLPVLPPSLAAAGPPELGVFGVPMVELGFALLAPVPERVRFLPVRLLSVSVALLSVLLAPVEPAPALEPEPAEGLACGCVALGAVVDPLAALPAPLVELPVPEGPAPVTAAPELPSPGALDAPVAPVVPALEAPPACATTMLLLSADACAANGTAKAPATATAIKVLNFIAVSFSENLVGLWLSQQGFTSKLRAARAFG